jgi:alanyl-tRNA synthetase
MFTNAGMNQFKDVFLGTGSRPYKRSADTQKCIRAGGKHNDLDDVGQDTYHHTFFEMLGNWSFGDYFKKEAIEWAWELLTKVWGIDKSRLHATYFGGLRKKGNEATKGSNEATRQQGNKENQSHDRQGAESEPGAQATGGFNRQSEWELEPDWESRDLWTKVAGLDPSHIHPGNMKDNFWEMGETGPCGPCSEIHIDLTPDKSGGHLVNKGDHRVMEIWNLVFIQFNRGGDGKLTPLPAKHVDTGMGFERLCAVLQGTRENRIGQVSNYDTDVFTPLFDAIQRRTGSPAYTGTLPSKESERGEVQSSKFKVQKSHVEETDTSPHHHIATSDGQSTIDNRQSTIMVDVSYRVIADHIRCLTFALTDGAIPSNEGRGYVLRRILRRAVRYGRQCINMHEPFLCDLVAPLVEHMAVAFPELRSAHRGKNVEHVTALVRDEEASFLKTLDRGIKLFAEAAENARHNHNGRISGEDAFKLHDTYGFPIDLTELMAEEQRLTIDVGEYERLMEAARVRARGSQKEFIGYPTREEDSFGKGSNRYTDDSFKHTQFEITASIRDCFSINPNIDVIELKLGDECGIHLDKTCFYAQQGGQVGDRGELIGHGWKADVIDTLVEGISIGHRCIITEGALRFKPDIGAEFSEVLARVSKSHRLPTMQNHTATHVLNWALREVLEIEGGGKVDQKGSLVDPEKTRFDFSHNKPLTDEELDRVEKLCGEQIAARLPVYAASREDDFQDQKKAREINTLRAVFGEKYPDRVRVVSIGASVEDLLRDPKNPKWMKYSVEFCGGTHVKNTAEIEAFVLTSEEGVAKGVRRVVGISGKAAREAETLGAQLLDEVRQQGNKATRQQGVDAAWMGEFQKRLGEAVIPIRIRRQIQAILLDVQKAMKEQAKESAAVSGDAALDVVKKLFESAQTVGGVTVVVGEVPPASPDALRGAIDWVRNKTESSAVLLGFASEGKVTLIAGMSKAAVDRGLKAGDLIKEICPLVGGKGGGRPDMAQGGGSDPSGLASAIQQASKWISGKLT